MGLEQKLNELLGKFEPVPKALRDLDKRARESEVAQGKLQTEVENTKQTVQSEFARINKKLEDEAEKRQAIDVKLGQLCKTVTKIEEHETSEFGNINKKLEDEAEKRQAIDVKLGQLCKTVTKIEERETTGDMKKWDIIKIIIWALLSIAIFGLTIILGWRTAKGEEVKCGRAKSRAVQEKCISYRR